MRMRKASEGERVSAALLHQLVETGKAEKMKPFRVEVSKLNQTIIVFPGDDGEAHPATYEEIDQIIAAWNSTYGRFCALRRPGTLLILENVEGRTPAAEPVTHSQLSEILAAWNEES